MQIQETQLKDVWIIKPEIFEDFRGDYICLYREKDYDELPPKVHFIESCWSSTLSKGVFRGMHYSPNCWKIYQCVQGRMHYIFLNYDENDPNFGKSETFLLKPYEQILKHPRYAAGFLALEDNTILYYMQSQYYDANNPDQKTFKWDDPRFKIWLPYKPILSKRDEQGEYDFRMR